jgi:hypothetical protein
LKKTPTDTDAAGVIRTGGGSASARDRGPTAPRPTSNDRATAHSHFMTNLQLPEDLKV